MQERLSAFNLIVEGLKINERDVIMTIQPPVNSKQMQKLKKAVYPLPRHGLQIKSNKLLKMNVNGSFTDD